MVLIVIGGLIVIIALIHFYSKKSKILRELKKGPSKPINTVKDKEYARLHGQVEVIDEPLIAPLSGRPCVYYHITVEQKTDKSWRTIINDFNHQDFYLNSGSEKAKISARNKNVLLFYLETDHERRSGWSNNPSQGMEAYLKKHGKDSKTWLFNTNKSLRYKEAVLEPSEKVVVKGVAHWRRLDAPRDGFSYSRILELSGNLEKKLLVTDLPKALKTLPKTK